MNLSKSIEKTTKTSLNQPPSKPVQSIELKHTLTPKPVGDAIQYLLNTIGFSPSNYAWNFGDSSQEVNTMIGIAKHTFQKPGRYLVIVTATDSFGRRISHEFSQLIYQPTTGKPAKNSTPIVLDAREFLLWNVNYDHHSVTATHTHNLKQKAYIPVGQGPTSLQFNKDELLWVVNQQSATVSIIDPFIFQLVKTLQLPKNSQPFGIAFDDEFAYITLEAIAQVLVIQLTPLKILKRIPVHAHPRHIAYLPHKKQLYISHFITPPLESEKPNERARKKTPLENQGGIISVISAQTHTIKKIITLHPSTYHDSEHSARGVPNYLGALSIAPEGTSAWVPGKQDNIFRGLYRDGQPLTHDTTIRSISAHIDLTTLEEKFDHRMDHDNAGVPTYALQDPSGSIMFIAFEGSQEIETVDLYTQQPLFRFQVEQMPIGMVMSQNYSRLFVLNELSRSITAHDTQNFFSGKSEPIPLVARTSTIPKETLPAILLKGKQLFHDAKDERLSQEQYLSCASCHHQGTQDGRVWDFSSLGEGLRNTISLIGKGQGHGLWHWSANFDEIQDFETPIRTLAGGLGLMKTTDYQKTAHPFGQKKQGKSSDLDALAAYVHSLNLYTPSPYQDDPKTQEMAIQGKKLFNKYRCASCHLGKNFTNSDQLKLFNIGTVLPSSGHRLGGKLSGIDTPTLHQLWNTAPYLHNGMAHRLEEAIQMHQLPKNPTKAELIYLRAYLYMLDGKTEVKN